MQHTLTVRKQEDIGACTDARAVSVISARKAEDKGACTDDYVSCGHLTIISIHCNFRIMVQTYESIVNRFISIKNHEIIAK